MLFNIREEVKPLFNIDSIGDVYVVNDIFNKTFPHMFLAYAPMLDKMYTFNCSDVQKGAFIEYVMFETTFDMINRSSDKSSDAIDLMLEASAKEELYLLLIDRRGFQLLEKYDFSELEDIHIPRRNTYFLYNKELLNKKKG